MTELKQNTPGTWIIATLFIAIGLGVFIIRLTHPGPYTVPQGGGFYGALAAIASGVFLLWSQKPKWAGWIVLLISPVALFPAIYSIAGESEEVISLYATDSAGQPADLRLWIVDRDDGPWVGMSRDKAIEHQLDGARLQMLRAGQVTCVTPVLHVDLPTAKIVHAMKVDKYVVAQAAAAIGLYPKEATASTAVLRLDPCPAKE